MNSKAAAVIASRAFQREAMRGEQIRIVGLLIVLVAVFLFFSGRAFIVGGPADIELFLPVSALLAAMAVYETTMLLAVRRGIERDRALPAWCWMVNVAVETLLPTIALLILTESEVYGPYRALAAPAVLAYFFFFILSILRLSPGMARVTGLASTIGYLAVIAYTIVRYPDPPEGALPLGNGLYLTYAAFLLIGGFVAGEVARQVRKHVTAALDEALHNERVHRDLELARTIQQGLLPEKPPIAPGFDVAGWNQPADQTGGDFFYWDRLADGRTVAVLADVTGHGIGPALIASVSRAYGRACFATDTEVGAALTRIDELLSEDLPSGKLVNFVAAVLDPNGSDVQLISAGQGPLLVFRAASMTVEHFKAHGVPLGVGVGPGYGPAQQVSLEPGDMLILVTDGFFEWENQHDEQFGLDRLDEAIRQARDLPAREIISTLHSAVLHFAKGTEQPDDLTAVIVKRER